MRWLQWSQYDLETGVGGVEVHARSLHREFLAVGIESQLSSDPKVLLDKKWDVIQTHGSSPLPVFLNQKFCKKFGESPLRIHTLHGSAIGRMQACHEWFWLGGYAAYAREWQGILQSKLILAAHPSIHLLLLAKSLGKETAVCWNGWDSAESGFVTGQKSQLSPTLLGQLKSFAPFFCFVGRGGDPVKNTKFLEKILIQTPHVRLVAIPGAGFKNSDQLLKTGPLNPAQIIEILKLSRGLLLTSHYEGLPLVVLEALGNGIPVFSTKVGGLKHLSPKIQGLTFLESKIPQWTRVMRAEEDRKREDLFSGSADHNRGFLFSWKQVTQRTLDAVSKTNRKSYAHD